MIILSQDSQTILTGWSLHALIIPST